MSSTDMFWQEDDTEISTQSSGDIVDVLFAIDCKRLPVDHGFALASALQRAAPWIAANDSGVAVHTIHVAGSQNGWERPEHGTDQYLILSKRTKLAIRVPKERVDHLLEELQGKALDVSGCALVIGSGKIRPLSKETTLFSRYVVTLPNESEDAFLDRAVQALQAQGVRVRKALCGKTTPLSTSSGTLPTRSLMLASLSPEESIRLQQQGLGSHRAMGCGIFIPHKGVEAVGKAT
jgi:CRISPR-associated protein Cas6